jgi:hypothetical protein
MTSDAPEAPPTADTSDPVAILTARGVPFRLHRHPVLDTPQEVCGALGIPLERTVKTLGFAESGGQVAGYALAARMPTLFAGGTVLELLELAVHNRCAGAGWARDWCGRR